MPFDELEEGLVQQLGRPLEEVFDHIVKEPLASASIAQVHRATLKGTALPRTPKSSPSDGKRRGKKGNGEDGGKEADDAMAGGYRSYKRKGRARQTERDGGARGKEVIIKVQVIKGWGTPHERPPPPHHLTTISTQGLPT